MKEKISYFSKKGFTLVELLAVIIVLGIILVLAVPRVTNMIDKYKDKAYNIQLDNIDKAVREYLLLYSGEINWIGNYAAITLKDIQNKGLLSDPLKNPKADIFEADDVIITFIKKESGSIKYATNVEGMGGYYTAQELRNMIENQGYIPIATASDLNDIRNNLNGKYVQVNDINLKGYGSNYDNGQGWQTIGYYDDGFNNAFTGEYDGNNYKITNLYINRPNIDFQGLFGFAIDAQIKNVALEGVNVTGNRYVGGLIARFDEGKIINSYVIGNVGGEDPDLASVGGLAGVIFDSEIISSYAIATISGYYIGGLLGIADKNCNIINSYVIGDLDGKWVGGLVSCGANADNFKITNSYAVGTINHQGGPAGGLVALLANAKITNSYAAVTIISENESSTGGLIGWNWDVNKNIIINSYWDVEVSGLSTSSGGIPKTNIQMKQQNTYEDWDFDDIWNIDEGVSYPYLRSNTQIPHPK